MKKYANEPFALIGVNSDPSPEKLKAVLVEKDLSWRSFFDGGGTGGPIATKWGVHGWPTIYVIDHEGIIRHKGVRGEKLDEALEALIAKAKHAE